MKCFGKPNKKNWIGAGFLMGILLLVVLAFSAPQRAAAAQTEIRVGYVGMGSVLVDEHGHFSGYLVDYLEEIAEYTGWKYEYVYGSWAENADRLERGELDLMGLVRHTEEREQTLLFSELSMADDHTALCAAMDSGFYYQDYEAFDGCRVGVVKETIYEKAFAGYARERDLDCEMEYYATELEAREALLAGEIDLLATGGLSDHSDLRLVDRFDLERTYFVTGKGNEALMEELNAALQWVRIEKPALANELTEQYFSIGDTLNNILLTREEQEYIDSAGTILVKGFSGRRPLGYEENGEFVGVLADYLNMLGEYSGLRFRFEGTDVLDMTEQAALMVQEGYALVTVETPMEEYGLEDALIATEPLFESNLDYLATRQAAGLPEGSPHAFALVREMSYLEELLLAENPGHTVRYYPTSADCVEALLAGEADMTIQDEHVATYLLEKPKYGDALVEIEGEKMVEGLYLYAPADQAILVRILDKTMDYLAEGQQLTAVANAVVGHAYEFTVEDALYRHGRWLLLSAVLVLTILLLAVGLSVRGIRARRQRRENEELQRRLQLDQLTGIYNRTYFLEKAEEMIARSGNDICIVRLNVCNFKLVNELYGAKMGDRLLREIAQGLKELAGQRDFVVGRFTGDHFYLCIRQKDFEAIDFPRQAPAPWLGMDISLTYGVYQVGEQKDVSVNIICDRANMANSSQGQSAAEHIRYYSDEERQRMLRDQEIESEMEKALAQGQFCIYIQPKYDIETERLVGGEALVRWLHPIRGMIPPGEFIGLFERNGFIRKLDFFVWEECCRFLARAREKGLPALPLSANVSRIHFYNIGLQDKLTELLEKYELDPGALELEITETICAVDSDVIFKKCDQLRRTGFRIAMDDFGSGYSALNMLKEMPLDIIKMDLRFLSGAENEEQEKKGRDILRTLIELAHALELEVVVEGLETKEQRDFIRTIGRCTAQGYYYSRPVDSQSFENLLSGV